MSARDSDDQVPESLEQFVPPPPPVLAGREAALRRLADGLREVSVAIVYGFAGVGKTAFVSAHVATLERRVIVSRAPGASLSAVLDDARRQLANGPMAELETDAARIRKLARQLDDHDALWFFDDIHDFEPAARQQLIETLSALLRKGRLVATSRQRVPVRPDSPHRLELLLEPLDETSSRQVWTMLDKLYGQVPGFEQAFDRTGGIPFALRQSHAGGAAVAVGGDPIASTLEALSAEERRIALALALARISLPEDSLRALVSAEHARDAVRGLFRRLVLEVDGSGNCSIHDIFRERLRSMSSAEEQRELHATLASVLSTAPVPAVIRCREVVHQFIQAGSPERAGEYLMLHAGELVRHGAAAELLTEFERLPRALLTADMDILRGRSLVRVNEIEQAHALLARTLSNKPNPLASDQIAFAQAALLFGRLDQAEQALQAAADSAELSPEDDLRHAIMLASLRAIQGRPEEARELVARAQLSASSPATRAKLEGLCAFSYWAERRYAEAETAARRVKQLLATSPGPRSASRIYITSAVVYTNLGLFEDAQQSLRESGAGLEEHDELVPVALHVERSILLSAQGEVLEAVRTLHHAVALYYRLGHRLGAWWASTQLGRNLLLLGRVREGLRVLDAAERGSLDAGALIIAASAQAERAWVPERLLEDLSPVNYLPFLRARLRTIAVTTLLSTARGSGTTAMRESAAERKRIEGLPGCGLDRAIFRLAEAIERRLQGDLPAFEKAMALARDEAASDDADADVVDGLLKKLGALVIVRGDGSRCLLADAPELSRSGVVIDAREGVVHFPSGTIELGGRAVLRKMIYVLAMKPGQRIANEEIVQAVWNLPYNPLTHDNVLRVNVRRLRTLLEPTPLRVVAEDVGYGLVVPKEFLFIAPLA